MKGYITLVICHKVPVTAKKVKDIDGNYRYGNFKLSKSRLTSITKYDIIDVFNSTMEGEMEDTFQDDECNIIQCGVEE